MSDKPQIVHVDRREITDRVKGMRRDADRILRDAFELERVAKEKAKAMRLAACGVKIEADKLEGLIT
jgi:hypothetical protein